VIRAAVALVLALVYAPEKPRIELFWSDYELLERRLSPGARKALEREARAIFTEAGIDLVFFRGSPEDHGRSGGLRIVLMPRSAKSWALPGNAMGAILERNARAGTVYVFLPVVERTMGLPVEDKMIHDGRKAHALARALAWVLAHEVVHAVDPDIPHGPEGSLMSENLTAPLLLGHRLVFHEDTARRLFERLVECVTER
jgi:hypothetical protein